MIIADQLLTYEYVAFAISLLLLIIYRSKRKAPLAIYRSYYWMIATIIVVSLSNILMRMMYKNYHHFSPILLESLTIIYMFMTASIGVVFTIYLLALSNINPKNQKIWNIVMIIPYLLEIGMCISARSRNLFFSFDENGLLQEGTLRGVALAVVGYYLLIWVIICLANYSKVGAKKAGYVFLMITIIAICSSIEYVVTGEIEVCFSCSMCLIIAILSVKNPDEIFDDTNALLNTIMYDELAINKDFYIYLIKLNDYKDVYESFGDIILNDLLKHIVSFLAGVESGAQVYRVSKDIFGLRVKRKPEEQEIIKKILIERLSKDWRIQGISMRANASVIVVDSEKDVSSIADLEKIVTNVDNTDLKIGEIYSASEINVKDINSEILNAIKRGIDNKSFQVYYQPIYSTEKRKIVSAEALIRLCDDELGFISPEIFIPLAEKEGYILQIGRFVMEEVCRFYNNNKLEEKGIEYIEINLSAVQCMQYLLAESFCEIMDTYDIKRNQINFEITETAVMKQNPAVAMNIDYFVNHNVELSLDDYGTGYSSMSYVYSMPFSLLKIDKGILWAADSNERADIVLKNSIKMAKKMGMKIVVEGVERKEHVDKLRKYECDYLQGYYYSKPVPGYDFISYVNNYKEA